LQKTILLHDSKYEVISQVHDTFSKLLIDALTPRTIGIQVSNADARVVVSETQKPHSWQP